jgi:excisionase family DNA binding protein
MATTDFQRINWRVNEFCQAFGIGRTKVYELIKAGDLESIRFGRRTVIPNDSAQALLARLRSKAK